MKKKHLIYLSILSGLLLTLSWPLNGFPFILFIAFIPLLIIEDHIYFSPQLYNPKSVFIYGFIAFFIWNLFTVWWIINSTLFGGIMAVLLNTAFMSVTFYLYHKARRAINPPLGQLILVFFWIAFEVIHMSWDLSFPWLNVGNGFATYPQFIQWYEYTGVLGGTAWILMINIFLFLILKDIYIIKKITNKKLIVNVIVVTLFVSIPIIYSLIRYRQYDERVNPISVISVQPNNDPYSDQYDKKPVEVVSRITYLVDSTIQVNHLDDDESFLIVCPESVIQERPLYDDHLDYAQSIRYLKNYFKKYPNRSIIIGASTYYQFKDGEEIPLSARKYSNSDQYYNAYNTAIFMYGNDDVKLYHKSKLTPGVEKMPFKKVFQHIENLAIDLGGTVGTLGTDDDQVPFLNQKGNSIAPIICYESIYGDFCTQYVRNGAELLSVITNDGWWGDTPGHRQHFAYASLRAIETRRSIARSANTGISAFYNQRGDVFNPTKYWVETAIHKNLNLNNEITFYVKYGDYIGRVSIFASILILLMSISKILMKKTN